MTSAPTSAASDADKRREAIEAIKSAGEQARAAVVADRRHLEKEIFKLANPTPARQLTDAENTELDKLDAAMGCADTQRRRFVA